MDQKIQINETSIVSFNIEGLDPQKIVDKLEQKKYYFSSKRDYGNKNHSCISSFF